LNIRSRILPFDTNNQLTLIGLEDLNCPKAFVQVPELQIPPYSFEEVKIAIVEREAMPANFLVGMDVLQTRNILIDTAKRMLTTEEDILKRYLETGNNTPPFSHLI